MKFIIHISLLFFLFSCQSKKRVDDIVILAKVAGHKLTLDETLVDMPSNLNSKDSAEYIRSYINEWTKHKLMLNKAIFNLSDDESQLERVVDKYREDLYIDLFTSNLIKQDLDTLITNSQLDSVYRLHEKMFVTRQPILQFRYVLLSEATPQISTIKKNLKYNPSEIEEQSEINKNYIKYIHEEGIWFKWSHVLNINPSLVKYSKTIKPGVVYQTQDNKGIHLIFIEKLVKENQKEPFRVVVPILKELILHQRKKALIRELEKDLIEQATRNKQIEIYYDEEI